MIDRWQRWQKTMRGETALTHGCWCDRLYEGRQRVWSPGSRTHQDLKISCQPVPLPSVSQGRGILKATKSQWARPAPWAEVVAWSRGRGR
jgi:hypothetical protein